MVLETLKNFGIEVGKRAFNFVTGTIGGAASLVGGLLVSPFSKDLAGEAFTIGQDLALKAVNAVSFVNLESDPILGDRATIDIFNLNPPVETKFESNIPGLTSNNTGSFNAPTRF